MEIKVGMTFGKLTIVKAIPSYFLCLCECGELQYFTGQQLKMGYIKSCSRCDPKREHGDRDTRLYRTWLNMKYRCNNKNAPEYHRYGGRGIVVCPEWDSHYTVFKDWALSHGYNDTLTIDRIDNDGNYCPENCQWITKSENSRKMNNTRRKK